MKFTDGYWHMRPGVTPHFAVQAHEVEVEDKALTVYAATKPLRGRGDTLNLPLLTVRFSSPMENVIRVQIVHHKGRQPRGPEFELKQQPTPEVQITDDAAAATLTSGALTVRVAKGPDWRVEFLDGDRVITSSGWRGMAMMDTPDGRFMVEQLSLGVGECVYGLGERFTPFVRNGQVVDLWNEDGGTASEQAYKNIPFYLTNRGYGVFVNHPEKVSYEVASEKVERVQFSVPGESLDYFLIYGPTPKEVLSRYTALTGRPALPPAWSFGLWLTTSFTTDYDEATVTSFIQGMADRDLPLHVFHFDCFWMREFHWCNFEWDRRCFPDPAAMLARLKARGLRICVWINPYIAQRSALFDEGMADGYLVKRPNGDVWQWDRWQAGMGLVDFTNPDACRWFGDKLRGAGRHGRGLLQDRFRRAHPDRCRLARRLRPAQDAQLLRLPVQQDGVRGAGGKAGGGRGGRLRPLGHDGRAAVPRPLGRRLDCHLRVDGREPARRPVALPLRLRLLEPRHGRLRADRVGGRLQALVRVRPALVALPAARQRLLSRALALR